ncbi:MAG TPA: copper amine oxidase N-terminal domain-containing protein, partial [Defluviitaleaceae bacterium]|nr:copper amine oxidase N-terminal domain-containing protein [Defluviitaleaceae bacterium]
MKRIVLLILSIIMLLSMAQVVLAENINVTLNGEPLYFDVNPQIINGRTMVPIRAIFEAMGANVKWD